MKILLWIGFSLLIAGAFSAPAWAEQLLYLSSIKDQVIVAYEVDGETGKLSKQFEVELPGNGGAMAFSPKRDFVYAAVTSATGDGASVCTLQRRKDGTLKVLKNAKITSRAPYIRADRQGQFLMAAHYGAGDVTVYRIRDGVCTDELLDQQTTARTAHCIEIDPSGKFVFVPHTAPNRVYQFLLDQQTGKLKPNSPPWAGGPDEDHQYHAPRHYAHHPKLEIAYTSNEAGGGISSWKFDPLSGTLNRLQTLSTLPPGYQGKSAAADIKITPDGRFAYVSNRDTTKRAEGEPTADTLAAVAIDEQGRMKIVGHSAAPHFPRTFCIDTTGRFLYAAGQHADKLQAFRIDPESGKLSEVASYDTPANPIWAMCAEVGS